MKTNYSLSGTWKFKEATSDKEYSVTIPGSVVSGLLENNCIEHPYYRMNEYPTRELMRKDYVFFTKFTYEGDSSKKHDLVMDGLDTVATVLVNNKEVISTNNMHLRYAVNIDDVLAYGENEIEIRFTSPIKYADSHIPAEGKEIHFVNTGTMPNSQYVRKASSMYGWDWGIQLPDMGIWREIYICEYENTYIESVSIEQKHNEDQSEVKLNVSLDLHNSDGKDLKTVVTVSDPDGKVIIDSVDAKESIVIKNPELWWPNRLGKQALYTVKTELMDGLHKIDEITEKIGLRTLTVSQDEDEWGKEFCFKVNGIKIFSKGADYIPEDAIYSNITKDVIKHLIDSSKEAGFNTIRVWGGGYYPSDAFYEMCDEAGLIIWQDFMFACNVYELWDEFKENITKEAVYNVRRIRNHASIGLICGNNELESAWENWGEYKDHSDALKKDYLIIFEELLPSIVKKEAPWAFYWPSSPSSTGSFNAPDDDNIGDRHYWDVWHGEKPFTDYQKYFFRYCSEFGFQSFPEMATIKKFAIPGDFNIFSPVMESHQKNGTANSKILNYISANFLYPKDFRSLVYVSQVLQGLAIKYGVEHFRRNRGRCMGSLYWQLNDNWPVASWASMDYYGRWKALHYMAKEFYADLLGSVKREGNTFIPYVQNESQTKATTVVDILVKNMQNEVLYSCKQDIATEAFAVTKGQPVSLDEAGVITADNENSLYVEAIFTHSDGTISQQVEPLKVYKAMNLPDAKVDITCSLFDEYTIEATVSADSFAAFVNVECEEVDIKWDKNYFFVTSDNKVKLRGTSRVPMSSLPKIEVFSLSDSYIK